MTPPPPPGDYIAQRRQAAGLGVREVASRIGTIPHVNDWERSQMIEAIERDAGTATIHTIAALRSVFPFSGDVLFRLMAIANGEQLPAPRLCTGCGCSEFDPCREADGFGCWWVTEDRCSSCAPADLQDAGPDDTTGASC